MATPQCQNKSPPHRGPGRPSPGIRSGYARVEVYLPVDIRDGLDRLADRREQHTGQATQRANVIREVLIECLRQLLPEAKI